MWGWTLLCECNYWEIFWHTYLLVGFLCSLGFIRANKDAMMQSWSAWWDSLLILALWPAYFVWWILLAWQPGEDDDEG